VRVHFGAAPGTLAETTHRYEVRFARELAVPLKLVCRDGAGQVIETILIAPPERAPHFHRDSTDREAA